MVWMEMEGESIRGGIKCDGGQEGHVSEGDGAGSLLPLVIPRGAKFTTVALAGDKLQPTKVRHSNEPTIGRERVTRVTRVTRVMQSIPLTILAPREEIMSS